MLILYSIFSVLCVCIGFYFGYKIGFKKELPEMNPIKVVENIKKEHKDIKKKQEQEKEQATLNQILDNINSFDGTSKGQKPII